jgi:hypothetical protein
MNAGMARAATACRIRRKISLPSIRGFSLVSVVDLRMVAMRVHVTTDPVEMIGPS